MYYSISINHLKIHITKNTSAQFAALQLVDSMIDQASIDLQIHGLNNRILKNCLQKYMEKNFYTLKHVIIILKIMDCFKRYTNL